jgi:hypothetical protein
MRHMLLSWQSTGIQDHGRFLAYKMSVLIWNAIR